RWCSWRWSRPGEARSIAHRLVSALTDREALGRDLPAFVPHFGTPGALDDLFFAAELKRLGNLLAKLRGGVFDDLARPLAGLGILDAGPRRPPDEPQSDLSALRLTDRTDHHGEGSADLHAGDQHGAGEELLAELAALHLFAGARERRRDDLDIIDVRHGRA